MNKKFFKSALRADLGKTAAQHSLLRGQLVHLFVEFTGEILFASSAAFRDADTTGQTTLRSRLHNQNQPRTKESDQIVVRAPKTKHHYKTLSYPYHFNTNEKVLRTLGDFYTSGF